jgi:hypothetical protein
MISAKKSSTICTENKCASETFSSKFVGSSPFVTLDRWSGLAFSFPGLTITSKLNY